MDGTRRQDDGLAANTNTNTNTNTKTSTYDALHRTALSFIAAQSHTPHLATAMDFPALSATTTSTYTHTFGPSYSVSQTPSLQGEFTFERFQAHLQGMTAHLQEWSVEVTSVVVDERGARVVVGVVYGMVVRGGGGSSNSGGGGSTGEVVQNEVVWVLDLEKQEQEQGEWEWRVGRSREVVDFGASARMREIMGR